MSETIRLGHRVEFFKQNGQSVRKFQNWFVNEDADGFGFLPFGFSGAVFSREGDNITATLVMPVDGVARSWAQEAIKEQWIAKVEVSVFTGDDGDETKKPKVLYDYVGQISASNWDATSIQLEMSTVLDAVQSDVPRRSLHQKLVGRLPTTGNIALS